MSTLTLRRSAQLYITALTVAALVSTLVALADASLPNSRRIILALVLTACMTVAWLFPIHFAFKTKLYLDACVIFAAILLFEPGLAALIAGTGTLLGHLVRRQPGPQTLFNSAQTMLQAIVGGLLLTGTGWDGTTPRFDRPDQLLLLAVVGAAIYLLNTLTVATIVGLQSGQAPLRVWYRTRRNADRTTYLAHLAQLGLGLLAVIIVDVYPWALILLVPPVCTIYGALRRQLHQQRRTEEALGRSETNLAEAQQLAQLGSWEWDLRTGEHLWSAEVYRLVGITPQACAPNYENFLAAIHPEERVTVDRVMHDALVARQPYSLDHRLRRPDGEERIVHHQGKVAVAADGQPVRLVGTLHDITSRKALEAQLAHQAFHDALTGLPNRALFIDRLGQVLVRQGRRQGAVAVLFIDLDRFKQVNDSLGHDVGDQLLMAVAARLKSCLRPGDTAARLGGDEFTLLLEQVGDVRDASGVAKRITEALQLPFQLAGHEVFVTASIGIVLGTPGQHAPADLLRDADTTMYRAKSNGKARYEVFDTHGNAVALARLNLEADLWRALERGEFRLYYQPQVALATGQIVGLEALVRWEHPQRGLMMPSDFIPLAEETGLILPLGRWVLTEACRQGRIWQAHNPAGPPLTIGVNLSAKQFEHPDLLADVAQVVHETGVDPSTLVLEITESVVLGQEEAHLATLRGLKGLGLQLALDDFGTGYSSLSYLKCFPVDILKIDKAFVAGLGRDARDTDIMRAMTTLAGALEMRVLAEGVEDAEQLRTLHTLGCELGQGFHFAPALASAAVEVLLADRVLLGADRHPRPALSVVRRAAVNG